MGKQISSLLTLVALLANLHMQAKAAGSTPQLLGSKKVGTTTVYTYEVTGENIQKPKEKSMLFGYVELPYALCSEALCTIDQNNPNKAKCVCPIYGLQDDDKEWRKASVGPKNFRGTKPTKNKDGELKTVVSNYSMANINRSLVPQTTCQFNQATGWANCFGVRCDVQFNNTTSKFEAVCQCPVVKTKTFVSIGPKNRGNCQQGSDQAWSAATGQQGTNNNYIIKELYKYIGQ